MASSTLTIPVALMAVGLYQLNASGTLDRLMDGFLADLSLADQAAAAVLLFSLVFCAVSLSHSASSSIHASPVASKGSKKNPISYPLEAIAKASTEKEKFLCMYPTLRDEIIEHFRTHTELPQESLDWIHRMMEYTVPGGKLNRGTTVVSVHRTLSGGDLTPLQTARASVLGWAIEFLQAFFLVADDVMDDSPTRRGQPCWYKLPEVQLIAINDSFLLESMVFTLLKRHFGDEPYYLQLVELFLDVVQKTEVGQLLDLTSQPMDHNTKKPKMDLSRFTMQRYKQIVKYKTAFYTFYLPVAIGMITSRVESREAYDLAESICLQMGEYFQIQDDYLDCFGDPELIGKVGTDIQDNKCSWLVVQALERATPAQRKLLEDNYGVWDNKKVAKVKKLYKEDLDLPAVFAQYEEDSFKEIQVELDKVKLMPRDVFELLLKKIYKRSK